jgi:Zn-dependent peptidase ImmA (M78 family)
MPAVSPQTLAEIPVNPEVLKWARSQRGLTPKQAAELLDISVSELADYESGSRHPTLGTLQDMSAKYQINYVSLFMPQPPPGGPPPLKDYRTRKGHEPKDLSLDTRVAIQEIIDTLEAFGDLRADSPELFASIPLDTIHKGEGATELAHRQRKDFRISVTAQQRWPSDVTARNAWRNAVERRGVFVYFVPMGSECSGVTIKHENLFAICVNDRETNNGARVFTLFHEYCHVLRRQTGISDERMSNPIERFCNAFAADFLIPFTALENILGAPTQRRDFTIEQIGKLARRFRISLSAMAIQLEQCGWSNLGLYNKIYPISRRPQRPPREDIKINPLQQQARRLGPRHTKITLEALRRGVINKADAYDLLRVDPTKFQALKALVE